MIEISVNPPSADEIKAIRKSVGTQAMCAKMSGVTLGNWQKYEQGDQSPRPSTWGAFLLAIDRHPKYQITPR